MSAHTITYLTTINFGAGSSSLLPNALAELRISRPLIVSDHGIAASGSLATILPLCGDYAAQFLDVAPNPTEIAVRQALEVFRQKSCDGIVAVGGGSPIDLAKGVAFLSTHDGELASYAAIEDGIKHIRPDVAPIIAVPTTAGTGSEVGRAALLTLSDGRKLGFISPYLIPKRAICDPELTLSLPTSLTATTGMDALSHCVETFLSPRFNPPADAIAVDGFARIWNNIRLAVANGRDLKVRTEMMMGALQGGLTFQKGLGAVHALSHALGGISASLHHGTLNAILLPAVMRFNGDCILDKVVRLKRVVGLPESADIAVEFEKLNAALGIPRRLSEIGVRVDMIDAACHGALNDHSHHTNPKTLDYYDYRGIVESVM